MRAFLRQVSGSEDLAESGLKVIAYFDALVEHRATLEACVRAAAALSQCTAGLRDNSSSATVRFNRRGIAVDGPAMPAVSRPVRIGDRDVGSVWLEHAEGADALDELIVERMATAAGVLWRGSPRPRVSTAALMETVVNGAVSADDRGRALSLLGLAADAPVDVLSVSSADTEALVDGLGAVRQSVWKHQAAFERVVVCSELLGNVGIVLAQPGPTVVAGDPSLLIGDLPDQIAVGVARGRSVTQLPDSWIQAQTASQFCGLLGFGAVVEYDDLGALAALALVPGSAIAANPDVVAVSEMSSTKAGRAALEALEQRFASGSVREAAAALYLHHSSVRYRLRHAEESLGVQLDDPRGRLRAELAVMLWRLANS